MKSFKVFGQQAQYIVSAFGLLVATFVPLLTTTVASAAQLTERSVALSSSSKQATGVDYLFNFTADNANAGAVVVQFCSNTPLMLQSCTPPTGFTAAAATVSGTGATISGSPTANQVVVALAVTASTNEFTIGNVTNPTAAGPIYARVITYDTTGNTANYTTAAFGAGHVDDGSVAISITDTIGVSGAVLETMTFCVSGEDAGTPGQSPITTSCAGSLTAPTLKLGKETSGVVALASDDVYDGTIYTQLSTNAVGGAVVSLKSSAEDCGGLIRSSDPDACDIGPAAITGTIVAGEAKFGVKTGATSTTSDGTIQPTANYSATDYRLNYATGNTSGVTSTYGDAIFNTAGAPASNKNMPLTFGASIANNTPAGNYSADLSLVATGKF